jgi:hypothetical protein
MGYMSRSLNIRVFEWHMVPQKITGRPEREILALVYMCYFLKPSRPGLPDVRIPVIARIALPESLSAPNHTKLSKVMGLPMPNKGRCI